MFNIFILQPRDFKMEVTAFVRCRAVLIETWMLPDNWLTDARNVAFD